jgi:hypothetical protein
MEQKLTVEDARRSLTSHAAEKGSQVREKYGPHIGWKELGRLLENRSVVRYPCEIVFDSTGLLGGELAHPFPNTDRPEDGFKICVHPVFMAHLDQVPLLVLYQLVLVNYGEFASADDAETFGANAIGMTKDDYYERLCELADDLAPAPDCIKGAAASSIS